MPSLMLHKNSQSTSAVAMHSVYAPCKEGARTEWGYRLETYPCTTFLYAISREEFHNQLFQCSIACD